MAGTTPLDALGVSLPVLAAPMAGGPTTPDMVVAAADAGSLGQVAAGYKSAEDLAAQLREVAARTDRYGVNLFAPNPVPIAPDAYARYAREIRADAAAYDIDTTTIALREDDDAWDAKLAVLAELPAPVVSFTFGLVPRAVADRLRRAGSVVVQTVTTPAEACAAEEAGADMLSVQAAVAGGHSGAFDPRMPLIERPLPELVADVGAASRLPIIAAGGVAGAADVGSALVAGAAAVAVGTLLLRATESGASTTHRTALIDPRFTETALTRAFTGRPARGLRNRFIDEHADAPLGYPALHFLTTGMRRAAAAAGDAERVHLWAGTGFRSARAATTADILRGLA